tara:strand:+ start:1324 stop:4026 length:2703 start_codon:yes stop_codon:yes gene_type:complete
MSDTATIYIEHFDQTQDLLTLGRIKYRPDEVVPATDVKLSVNVPACNLRAAFQYKSKGNDFYEETAYARYRSLFERNSIFKYQGNIVNYEPAPTSNTGSNDLLGLPIVPYSTDFLNLLPYDQYLEDSVPGARLDFLQQLAKEVFGSTSAVDLFSNEDDIAEAYKFAVLECGYNVNTISSGSNYLQLEQDQITRDESADGGFFVSTSYSGTTDSGVYTVVDKGDNGHFGYGAIFKVTFGVINEPGSHEPGTENLLEPGLSDTAIETMIKTIKNLVTIVKNDKTGTLMGFGEPGSLEPGVPASFNEPGGEILSSEPGNEPGEDKIPISNETTIVKDLMDLLIVTNNNTTWAINNTNNTNAINTYLYELNTFINDSYAGTQIQKDSIYDTLAIIDRYLLEASGEPGIEPGVFEPGMEPGSEPAPEPGSENAVYITVLQPGAGYAIDTLQPNNNIITLTGDFNGTLNVTMVESSLPYLNGNLVGTWNKLLTTPSVEPGTNTQYTGHNYPHSEISSLNYSGVISNGKFSVVDNEKGAAFDITFSTNNSGNPFVSRIQVISGGSDYANGDVIKFQGTRFILASEPLYSNPGGLTPRDDVSFTITENAKQYLNTSSVANSIGAKGAQDVLSGLLDQQPQRFELAYISTYNGTTRMGTYDNISDTSTRASSSPGVNYKNASFKITFGVNGIAELRVCTPGTGYLHGDVINLTGNFTGTVTINVTDSFKNYLNTPFIQNSTNYTGITFSNISAAYGDLTTESSGGGNGLKVNVNFVNTAGSPNNQPVITLEKSGTSYSSGDLITIKGSDFISCEGVPPLGGVDGTDDVTYELTTADINFINGVNYDAMPIYPGDKLHMIFTILANSEQRDASGDLCNIARTAQIELRVVDCVIDPNNPSQSELLMAPMC